MNPPQQIVFNLLTRMGPCKANDIVMVCDVHLPHVVRRILRELKTKGLITCTVERPVLWRVL